MKKRLLVILICLIGISNSGCAVVDVLDNMADNQKHAEKVSEELICCINEKDVDGIEQLFNLYFQNEEKLRDDIEDFLDYIDGEIVDYNINYRGEISSSIEDGKWIEQETQTKLENIITDTGKKYHHIAFCEYVICAENKDKIGIAILTLHDENNKLLCRICYM